MRTLAVALAALLLAGCGRETSPEQKQADQLLSRAREAYARNAFSESRSAFRASLALDEKLGRVPQAAEALERLAAIEAYAGRLDSSIVLYRAAAERHRSLADRDAARLMTLQTASLHRRMEDDAKAYDLLTEALRLAQLFKDEEGVGEIHRALAEVCRALEKGEEEAAHLEALLQAAMNSGNSAAQARVYREMGLSALAGGDHNRAAENLLKALTFAGQSRDSLLAIDILYRLAMTHTAAGNTPQAFEAYTDALRRTDVTRGAQRLRYEMLTRVGTVYLASGAPADAARFYRPALSGAIAAGDKLAEGYLFVQLGHCEALTPGGMDNALRNYRAALELFSASSYYRGAAYALAGLGAAAERNRELTEALQYYRQAVDLDRAVAGRSDPDDVFSECETVFRENRGPAAEDPLVELLLQLGRSDEAFWFVEQRHARALAEDLAAVSLHTGEQAVDSLLDLWHDARRRTIGAERQLGTLLSAGPEWQTLLPEAKEVAGFGSRQMEELAAAIVQRRPSLGSAVSPAGLTPAEVRRTIPPGSALVVYACASRSLYTFVLNPAGSMLEVSAVPRRTLLGQAEEFWSTLQDRIVLEDSATEKQRTSDRRLLELSSLLYAPFMRPVEARAAGVPDLFVVLPREFGMLPLHALRRGGAVRRFVAEQSALRYLPSASSLGAPGATPARQYTVTGLGHPGSTGWDVEYELRDIRAFYRDALLVFGEQATFEGLKRAGGEVLHVTAEFRYGERSAANSSLLLSDGKTAGGTRSTAWGRLPSLPPRAVMVVSDLGRHLPRKNPLLARLILMGGTREVVLHSFTPLRKSRKDFGEGLYTALLAGAAPDGAFHQAQLAMIRTSQPLHHWAAFSLWGK